MRQFSLRADGALSIVCPVADDSELAGVNIFDATAEEAARIMDADPGVKAAYSLTKSIPFGAFPAIAFRLDGRMPEQAPRDAGASRSRGSCRQYRTASALLD